MLKDGKYRAFRNIPIGWVLQAIHSTDKSEKRFRIWIESLFFILLLLLIYNSKFLKSFPVIILFSFFITHSLSWLFTGNFWVYMLDSFKWVKNPGIDVIINFLVLTKKLFSSGQYCDSILIYGSMCRRQFHNRSVLDLRIVRRTDSWLGFLALPIGMFLRFYSFFIFLPVDLQVVDSMNFLSRQMRADEKPIVVYASPEINLKRTGIDFDDLMQTPEIVLRNENAQ